MVGTVGYLAVWSLGAIAFFQLHNFEVLFLLALITLPSSLAVSALHDAFGLRNLVFDLFGFLVFGGIQYALIGYALGLVVQWVLKQCRDARRVS